MILSYNTSLYNFLTLRITTENVSTMMGEIEAKWKELYPERPFDYTFVDEAFEKSYASEDQFSSTVKVFTLLAIIIGCLGLFGLANFTTQQRTKEIGIRKVLGSSVTSVVFMLYKDFLKLITVSTLIAWPITYYLMKSRLSAFPYQAEMSTFNFLAGALLTLVIALATVSNQSLKAALANPIDSIRRQ